MCFICPYYSETKNKVGKERGQAYPFSSRMICSVVHGAKRGREKKKKKEDGKKWNCKSTPFLYLPISACLELLEWNLGDLTSHMSSSKSQRETLFRHWQSDNSSSGPDFEALTSIQELRSSTPEMWLRNRQQKPNNSSWHLNSNLLKKKKNERK